MARGELRVYLGAAPGVGKTFAMLGEGRRRHERGTDVVVGLVETHGRQHTADMIGDLEVIPRKTVEYRGARFTEMDVDAILTRHPDVAVIDELAHTNVPGCRNEKRWQDVEDLLAAGITVITTLNIQHLESLNDVVTKITGVVQRETIPDAVVRAADQVELIDQTAEALRRRMAHGNIYPPDKVDAALAHYFRIGNLTALRELAMLWLADKVEDQLDHYREQHAITGVWETRERVVVALTGGPEGETLIRRGARIAARAHGGDLLAVHVARSDGLTGADPAMLAKQRRLIESLGGSYHQVIGDHVPTALMEFARAEHATQLVVGASRRSALTAFLTGRGTGAAVIRLSGDIDVHVVTHEYAGTRRLYRLPAITGGLTLRRRIEGAIFATICLPLLTVLLTQARTSLNLTSDVLIFLLAVVIDSLIGGVYPAVLTAIAASLLLNYYFIPPLHLWTIAQGNNVLALVAFVAVAVMVSSVVDVAGRRHRQAARASAEAQTLATAAGSVLRGEAAVSQLLERLRETFAMTSAALLERRSDVPNDEVSDGWCVVEAVGAPAEADPSRADVEVPLGANLVLTLRGRVLPAEDRRLLAALAAHVAAAVEQQRLAQAAEAAKPLVEADRTRTALLAAVSHDLRSPLASAQAAVGGLRSSDVDFTDEQRAELLDTANTSLDKLARLVDNLLDMSRLQAGALSVFLTPVAVDEVMVQVLDDLDCDATTVQLQVPETLPQVRADPALLERVLVNLLTNALRYSPVGQPPLITASELAGHIEVRVIDRGPGIPKDAQEKVFAPFQRLGDHDNSSGVGLGLALARGLTEAMHGTLAPEETPGGGLTMVLVLPAADRSPLVQDHPPPEDAAPGVNSRSVQPHVGNPA